MSVTTPDSALQACVGETLDPERPGRDPVNVPMIRNWCDALGDRDPVYLDDDAARAAGFPGIVAPPGMLRTWTMLPPHEQLLPAGDAAGRVYVLLEQAGYTSKAATNCDLTFARYLTPGDDLRAVTTLGAVSEEKRTALGRGFFVDSTTTFRDAGGAVVATMGWRSLRFRPGSSGPRPAPAGPAPTPVVTDGPPPWRVPITRTLVIAGAMASRDYQDVHHDPELARERGLSDIFTNMMTTTGLVSRYVTDWTGPTGRLHAISLTLGVPNHPGDTLLLSVTGTEALDDHRQRLMIAGTNSLGRHVLARVTVERPGGTT